MTYLRLLLESEKLIYWVLLQYITLTYEWPYCLSVEYTFHFSPDLSLKQEPQTCPGHMGRSHSQWQMPHSPKLHPCKDSYTTTPIIHWFYLDPPYSSRISSSQHWDLTTIRTRVGGRVELNTSLWIGCIHLHQAVRSSRKSNMQAHMCHGWSLLNYHVTYAIWQR